MRSQEKNRKRSADADRSEVARRVLLAMVLGLCLAACDPEGMKNGLVPWHMWGNSETVNLVASGPGTGVGIQQNQLIKIAYARPETWRWVWEVTVQDGNVTGDEGGSGTLVVVMRTTTGLGRSQMTIPLGRMVFVFPLGPIARVQKFTNNVNGPLLDDTIGPIPAPPFPNVVNTITGQDIQVQIESQWFSGAGDKINFETTALFAPQVHVRPEWSSEQFPGDETQGR